MSSETGSLLDFGRGHWFEHLDAMRRFLWDPKALERLVGPSGLDLRAGALVADFGCGWGYLGHLLRHSVAPGGRIDGFDLSEELLDKARRRAREAGARGLRFELGDACGLDVDDNRYDRAICQTVLIHQSDPERVVREMARVVKPGGIVVAIEPDLCLAALSRRDDLVSDAHLLDLIAVQLHVNAGARACGAGHYTIGGSLPALFASAGLRAPRAWLNPTLCQCTPPYDAAGEQYRQLRLVQSEAQAAAAEWQALRPLFEAGDGDGALWQRTREAAEVVRVERRQRLLDGTCAITCTSALTVCVARVP